MEEGGSLVVASTCLLLRHLDSEDDRGNILLAVTVEMKTESSENREAQVSLSDPTFNAKIFALASPTLRCVQTSSIRVTVTFSRSHNTNDTKCLPRRRSSAPPPRISLLDLKSAKVGDHEGFPDLANSIVG